MHNTLYWTKWLSSVRLSVCSARIVNGCIMHILVCCMCSLGYMVHMPAPTAVQYERKQGPIRIVSTHSHVKQTHKYTASSSVSPSLYSMYRLCSVYIQNRGITLEYSTHSTEVYLWHSTWTDVHTDQRLNIFLPTTCDYSYSLNSNIINILVKPSNRQTARD